MKPRVWCRSLDSLHSLGMTSSTTAWADPLNFLRNRISDASCGDRRGGLAEMNAVSLPCCFRRAP